MQLADPALPRARGLARVEERLAMSARTPARPSARRRSARRPTSPRRSRLRRCRRRASARPADRRRRRADRRARCSNSAMSALPTATLCRAASTRLPSNVVRSAAASVESGSGSVKSPSATNDGVYASERPQPDEHVLDEPAQSLRAGKPPEHRVAARQREGDVGEPKARDLLDQVDLPRHVARAPRRHEEPALRVAVEAESVQDRRLLVRRRPRARAPRRCARCGA